MQTETAIQQKILELAKRYGVRASDLTEAQYLKFSLMARETFKEKVDAATSALGSMARTKVLGLKVLPEVAAANKEKCINCPSNAYKVLADGSPSCGKCGCAGRFLINKWVDPNGECPEGHWKNVGMPTVNSKKIAENSFNSSGSGDASGSVTTR